MTEFDVFREALLRLVPMDCFVVNITGRSVIEIQCIHCYIVYVAFYFDDDERLRTIDLCGFSNKVFKFRGEK